MRATFTYAERKLWSLLRSRRLGGFKFRRQVPIDRYFADFACVEARLIVEVDGGLHQEEANAAYDVERMAFLETAGWHVMRFWNADIIQNIERVGDAILAELKLARP